MDEEWEMKSSAFKLGLAFAILVGLTFAAFEGKHLAQQFGMAEKDPVLVFVIPDLENARRVRAAIAEERIAWQGAQGLALSGGRVVALNLDDAGDVIEEAGWVDHPIQIVRLENPEADAEDGLAGGDRELRLARLRSLVNKPTLTRGEQMFVLMAMNDGIEL
jgi:hypothetical protein